MRRLDDDDDDDAPSGCCTRPRGADGGARWPGAYSAVGVLRAPSSFGFGCPSACGCPFGLVFAPAPAGDRGGFLSAGCTGGSSCPERPFGVDAGRAEVSSRPDRPFGVDASCTDESSCPDRPFGDGDDVRDRPFGDGVAKPPFGDDASCTEDSSSPDRPLGVDASCTDESSGPDRPFGDGDDVGDFFLPSSRPPSLPDVGDAAAFGVFEAFGDFVAPLLFGDFEQFLLAEWPPFDNIPLPFSKRPFGDFRDELGVFGDFSASASSSGAVSCSQPARTSVSGGILVRQSCPEHFPIAVLMASLCKSLSSLCFGDT